MPEDKMQIKHQSLNRKHAGNRNLLTTKEHVETKHLLNQSEERYVDDGNEMNKNEILTRGPQAAASIEEEIENEMLSFV